ncbi:hypothetical protein HDU87_000767 [Geranomyces variabilis]|uniref:3'-phosphate/5'-hydroxy nucleic acid ligase n=1 Tax=Geranomyces variabilis TaxID=109894 RepID=A0AAD5TN68_9FUNG|nr:hypothetical protein HDU87_000767 [Geranomyces variabilis]
MRTRFDFVHCDNQRAVRPLVLTYDDAESLALAMKAEALGRFKHIKKSANVRFYVNGTLVQDLADELPFPDGTRVVIYDKASAPAVSAREPADTSVPAPTTFLHAETVVDEDAIQQLYRVAKLPGMVACVGMPDLHLGSGAYPVGAAFVASRIIPELVGSDIGCGMTLFPLPGVSSDLTDRQLQRLSQALGQDGFQPGEATVDTPASQHPLAAAHARNFGTIGGGNHFAELQVIHELLEPGALDTSAAYLLVHSGSRTLGEAVAAQFKADGDLQAYCEAHKLCVTWASDNRRKIGQRFADVCSGGSPTEPVQTILDITHNSYVPVSPSENPQDSPHYLHRKGAAPMDAGQLVAIPGSRGTYTYIVRPSTDAEVLARCACSIAHGAGRAMSRGKVTALLKGRYRSRRSDAVEALQRTPFDGYVVCPGRVEVLYEEAPEAYKDIELVIRDLVAVGAISVVAVMKPLITCKM